MVVWKKKRIPEILCLGLSACMQCMYVCVYMCVCVYISDLYSLNLSSRMYISAV